MDVDSAADELYTVRPSEFTKRRSELARQAENKATATAITKLQKPTVAGWLANLLVAKRPKEIEAFVQLGAELRSSQANFDATELRQLSQQRREVVGDLIAEARALAQEQDQRASDEQLSALHATLSAVLADAEAAQQFRAGRLVKGLSYVGIGPLEVGPGQQTATNTRPPERPVVPDESEDRRRRQAEHVLQEVRAKTADSLRRVEDLEGELSSARATLDERRSAFEELQSKLNDARQGLDEVQRNITAPEKQYLDAGRDVASAGRAQTKAEQALSQAEGR